MDQKAIAERVAKSVTGGIIKVPTMHKSLPLAIEILDIDDRRNTVNESLVQIGDRLFNAEQLDTLIDTLKSARRRM